MHAKLALIGCEVLSGSLISRLSVGAPFYQRAYAYVISELMVGSTWHSLYRTASLLKFLAYGCTSERNAEREVMFQTSVISSCVRLESLLSEFLHILKQNEKLRMV